MPTLLKFPAPESTTTRGALQRALDEKVPLTNVLILSQRENGNIYHVATDSMTLGDLNWLVDSYKFWLMQKASSK